MLWSIILTHYLNAQAYSSPQPTCLRREQRRNLKLLQVATSSVLSLFILYLALHLFVRVLACRRKRRGAFLEWSASGPLFHRPHTVLYPVKYVAQIDDLTLAQSEFDSSQFDLIPAA